MVHSLMLVSTMAHVMENARLAEKLKGTDSIGVMKMEKKLEIWVKTILHTLTIGVKTSQQKKKDFNVPLWTFTIKAYRL